MLQPRRLGLIGLALMGFFLTLPNAIAQNTSCGGLGCSLPPNFEEQIVARYDIDVDPDPLLKPVSCHVTTGSVFHSGPICTVTVHGPMQPPPNAGGETPLERARSISRSMLQREAILFGISDLREIRETYPRELWGDFVGIGYARFIGDVRMAFTLLDFGFKGDGTTLRHWTVSFEPAPPALYEAVKRERLPVNEIKAIVARDLGRRAEPTPPEAGEPAAGGSERPPSLRLTDAQIKAIRERGAAETPVPEGRPEVGEPELLAFGVPPFLRWKAYGVRPDGQGWCFTIDAFTGEI